MEWYYFLIIVLGVLILFVLGLCFYLYLRIFYNNIKGRPQTLEPLKGKLYDPFADKSRKLIKKALSLPFEQVYLKVNKHKRLAARYYFSKGIASAFLMQARDLSAKGV